MRRSFKLYGFQLLLINSSLFIFSACSVQKGISASARQLVLKDSSLLKAHVGISIFDPATGNFLYNYQGDKYFVPASNTKIPTCYAAMKYLGDSLVGLEYLISANGSIDIRPTGDPTFLHPDFADQPVFSFLKKQHAIIFTRNSRSVSSLGSGWAWNDYMEAYMAPKSQLPVYGNLLRLKWINKDSVARIPGYFKPKEIFSGKTFPDGFDLHRSFGQNDFTVLNGTKKQHSVPFEPSVDVILHLLADTLGIKEIGLSSESLRFATYNVIHSQATDSMLKLMMHRSDNFFAEQSLLMVSNQLLGYLFDSEIRDTLLKTDFKDLPQKPRWADGSGLSRYNLFTPQDFVFILNKMRNEFGMERIKVILPTGGEGTISSYYKADSGYIYGKTGTLSGVVAFSGYLYTKKGKLLIFSTLVNNHQASATAVRKAIEKFLQRVRNQY